MRELAQNLKQFLEKYIDLIDNNNFSELYYKFQTSNDTRYMLIAKLSEVLLECDINPIPYFNDGEIPPSFLAESDIIKLPNITANIKNIKSYAFYGLNNIYGALDLSNTEIKQISLEAFGSMNNITTLILPESLETLKPQSFVNCSNLSKVYFGKNIKNIHMSCFRDCSNIHLIEFNMRYNTFINNVYLSSTAFSSLSPECEVKFLDKSI